MEAKSEESNIEEIMRRVSFSVIGIATVVAFVLSIIIDASPESFEKILFVGLFLFLAISTLVIVRFAVLPSLAQDVYKPRETLFITGYTEATFPAILAVIWSILVSEWWVAIMGGVLGVVYWLAVRDYLNRVRAAGD